ncbi:cytochrome P450 4d1-like [Drosophila pseudoobscura]|uniref:Cytochrome P450 4d1-like n=1 Tax=Drosophila pseudoobscura pseudoobscura TaxID=46245 RepID=A0A6I8UZF9_DROPS|nr:cytochrome P450 4d1 [Drosophila pseudoobscura]
MDREFYVDHEFEFDVVNSNSSRFLHWCIGQDDLFMHFNSRRVVEECEINGKRIPAGTNIGISPLYLGRRVELFSEPNSFKPERFDVVTSAEKLNPYAYIPFSAGPRNCIGQKFAMLEIKAIVANVLRHYHIDFVGDTTEPPVLIAELILRTKDPLLFKLQDRVY